MNEPLQKGGMDPGLAALIAALLTGSIGSYGYLTNKESPEAAAEKKLQLQIDAANKTVAAANDATKAKEAMEATLKAKEAELTALKAQLQALKSSAATASEFAVTFKNATPDALTRAVPEVLKAMHFNPDGSDAPNVKSALEYPGSYQGRLMRMSLFDFYYKRLKPAFEKDVAKAKKGGDATSMSDELAALEAAPAEPLGPPGGPGSAAMYSPYLPNYDEFAKTYADIIKASTLSTTAVAEEKAPAKQALTDKNVVDKKAEDKDSKKKNAAAKKNAELLRDKILNAISKSEKEFKKNKSFVENFWKLNPQTDAAVNLRKAIDENMRLRSVFTNTYLYVDDENPGRLEDVITEWQWVEVKDDATKLLEDINKSLEDFLAALKEAKEVPKNAPQTAPTGPTSIHDTLLTETPAFLKKIAGLSDEVKKMMKGLNTEMKQIPMPEQYKGGCAVKVLGEEMQEILQKISTVIGRRSASLQKAIDDYKKETKGTPIYDTSLQRSESEETALATSKSSIDRAVAGINQDTEMFFATVERMKPPAVKVKGGARALQKVFDLRDQIDLGVYALKRFSANIIGLKDSYETLVRIIERTKENRLATPAEWEIEKKSCASQVEELKKKVYRLPESLGKREGVELVQNPMFGPKKPGAPPASPAPSAQTSEPATPSTPLSVPSQAEPALPTELVLPPPEVPAPAPAPAPIVIQTATGKDGVELALGDTVACKVYNEPTTGVIARFEDKYDPGSKSTVRYVVSEKIDTNGITSEWSKPAKSCTLVSGASEARNYVFPVNATTQGTVRRTIVPSPPDSPTVGGRPHSRKRTLKKRRGGK